MIANLLHVAGVNHIITIDLHANQMQGFFQCPIDNLVAEPLISHWIRHHYPSWQQAVVVSKNPGGTKRVTSLADALKLSFGIVTTDRRRAHGSVTSSASSIVGDSNVGQQGGSLDGKDTIQTSVHEDESIPEPLSAISEGNAETFDDQVRRYCYPSSFPLTFADIHNSLPAM